MSVFLAFLQMSELSSTQVYKHKDISHLLTHCPVCNSSEEVSIWSSLAALNLYRGKEGITCNKCRLDLSFCFKTDKSGEIIDEYILDYFKLGNIEFKNNDCQLTLYLNNTYIKNIETNSVDLDKCKGLIMVA